MKTKIIGIAGKKKVGKDLVCDYIKELLAPKLVNRIAFADALKGEVARGCSVTGKEIVDIPFIEKNKDAFRMILQGWGTDFRRNLCDKNYWILKLKDTIDNTPSHIYAVVIPDVRFLNEAYWIKSIGGTVIQVSRRIGLVDNHISETELCNSDFPFDFYISNESSLEELKLKTQDMLFTTKNYV